jgi:tRNA nucleotidyltransferase (CCA-adding enzyme)
MKIYCVGGAVRDELLGLPVKDRDYVVVGATPEEMLQQGFKPVGKDFPVFLHPRTHEEYALARTERKTARGYHGFEFHTAPDVTLEQDLARRDLTINAMAKDPQGKLIDPFNGAADLKGGVLRHVSHAFQEDPVRILRVARFAARLGFNVAPETMELMSAMARHGEADALVPERVWQEFARGFMEAKPSRMLGILRDCGALARIAPELDTLWQEPAAARDALHALDASAAAGGSLEARFGALARALDPLAVESLAGRLKMPADCRDLALLAARYGHSIAEAASLGIDELFELFEATDAWRRPGRFKVLIDAALADEQSALPARSRLERALAAAARIDAAGIAKSSTTPAEIGHRVAQARLAAIRDACEKRE